MKQLVVGLTGGIGVGKTTVAKAFSQHGAAVIDVDLLGRQVLELGGGAYGGVVEAFGPDVVEHDGSIDRGLLAERVFGSGNRLAELESISHPAINAELSRQLAVAGASVVVLDMAVLAESRLGWLDGVALYQRVVVVEAAMSTRLARLELRGMSREQIDARIAAQASDGDRRLLADLVIPNDGNLEELDALAGLIWPTFLAWQSQPTS